MYITVVALSQSRRLSTMSTKIKDRNPGIIIRGGPGRTDRSRGTADDERAGQEEEREEKAGGGGWRREQQGEGQETEG